MTQVRRTSPGCRRRPRAFPPPGPIAEHAFLAGAISVAARIADTDERLDSAAAAAADACSRCHGFPALAWSRSALALIAVQRGDADAAEGLYGAHRAQGARRLIIPLSFDRLLGLLADTPAVDAALAHFEDGLAFCERAGYRPEYAWTASDYAEALLGAAPATGPRPRLQEAALVIARELGMRPLVERILSRREITR